jgi:GNAT superfamily N-acetyltransferase
VNSNAASIRPAGPPDVDVVVSRIVESIYPSALAAWLVADPGRRAHVLHEVVRIHVEHVLATGWIWIIGDHDGVAVWLPGGLAPPPAYDRRLAALAASYAPRFQILDRVLRYPRTTRETRESHLYLAFLAVAAPLRGRGIGRALLAWQHRGLDHGGMPAYLAAGSVVARQFYLRHGYRDHGLHIDLPDGPRLWPMRREPHRELQ